MALMIKRTMAMLTLSAGLLAGAGCGKSDSNAATKYTCPMHPEVVQDKQANCPKCGMKLVEKR